MFEDVAPGTVVPVVHPVLLASLKYGSGGLPHIHLSFDSGFLLLHIAVLIFLLPTPSTSINDQYFR